jgi:hypothetical protein
MRSDLQAWTVQNPRQQCHRASLICDAPTSNRTLLPCGAASIGTVIIGGAQLRGMVAVAVRGGVRPLDVSDPVRR